MRRLWRARGGELELAAQVTERLWFNLGVGYVRSLFDDFPGYAGVGTNAASNEASYAPEWTANAAVDHTFPLSFGGSWVTHLDYTFYDDHYMVEDGGRNLPAHQLSAYGVLNGRVGYQSADERWSVFLWARNLTDKTAISSYRITCRAAAQGLCRCLGW
jgi:iron complex outermembrane receptor protein